jgi:hypothetical protein
MLVVRTKVMQQIAQQLAALLALAVSVLIVHRLCLQIVPVIGMATIQCALTLVVERLQINLTMNCDYGHEVMGNQWKRTICISQVLIQIPEWFQYSVRTLTFFKFELGQMQTLMEQLR